jgi:hypothetical protein
VSAETPGTGSNSEARKKDQPIRCWCGNTAPVDAAALAAAWDAGYEKRAATLGMTDDPNPYRALGDPR